MKVLLSIRLASTEPEHVLGKTLVFRAFETTWENVNSDCGRFVNTNTVAAYIRHELGGGDIEAYAEDLESGDVVYREVFKSFCKDWYGGRFDYCVTTQKQLFD